MAKIKILIADNSFLIRAGFRSIISANSDFKLVGEAEKAEELTEKLFLHNPEVLVLDYNSIYFSIDDILVIKEQFPNVNILAVTSPLAKNIISAALSNGVISHLLKDCGMDEITEAIYDTAKGEKFFCGKVVNILLQENTDSEVTKNNNKSEAVSCDGIKLSMREIEIIQNVAEGFNNKEIANRLFLSVHTVTTHRKNIMSKLGVNNTAGLMMYAIRQNLLKTEKFLSN